MAEQSRNEEILRSIIDETEYDKTPQSREEELLLELKQTIEGGGGASVVPNPEGEATETLNKLGIDDTVYGFPKELPAVTSADAGDVLGVNSEGLWEKVAQSNQKILKKSAEVALGTVYKVTNLFGFSTTINKILPIAFGFESYDGLRFSTAQVDVKWNLDGNYTIYFGSLDTTTNQIVYSNKLTSRPTDADNLVMYYIEK